MDRHFVRLLALGLAVAMSGCFDLGDGGNSTDDPDDPMEGGGDGGEAAPKKESVTVEYIGIYPIMNLDYTAELKVQAGVNLTVTFENSDSNPLVTHNWYLEALDVGTAAVAAGETTSVTFLVTLEPGEYPYYCSIGDHRSNGLAGILTVTEPSSAA